MEKNGGRLLKYYDRSQSQSHSISQNGLHRAPSVKVSTLKSSQMYIDWSSRYGLSSVLEKILVFKLFFYSESSMHGINFTCLLGMQWNVMDEVEVIADSFLEEHKKYTYMYSTWACSSIHWINLQCRFFVEAKGFEENVHSTEFYFF